MVTSVSTPREGHGMRAQRLIERGEWQPKSLREFEIRCVVERQPTSLRQAQRRIPGVPIHFGIDGDGKRPQIRDSRADSLVPDGGFRSRGP